MESLTRELIDSQLMIFVEVMSEEQRDGVTRWGWVLTKMAGETESRQLEKREFSFEFSSFETARNYALGWIRLNRPALEKAAVQEAIDGIRYRASKTA